MKSKKWIFLMIMMLLAAVALGACGKSGSNESSSSSESSSTKATAAPSENSGSTDNANSDKKPYIPIISKGFQHQFWQAVKLGAEKAAKEFNVEITFEGPENESQVDKQIEMLQTALDKHPAAIAFAALDSKAAIPLLQKAQAANIPVIAFDSGVDSDIPITTAATDNKKAAALAADKMAELIGGKGEIAMVVHDQTSRTGVDRQSGFEGQIKAKYPDIKIVDIQYSGDQLKAADLTKAIIQAHPNLKGIFGSNEGAVIGAIHAVEEMKKQGKLVVIGYDSGKQQLDAIRSGLEAGAITQDPIGIGYQSVKAAVDAINGKQVPKFIDTGFHWYDKSNIDAGDISPLLYN